MAIIIGIDPGTTDVGFAIVKMEKNIRTIITYGVIHTTPKSPQTLKLFEIMTDLRKLLKMYSVTHAGIEKLFFTTNMKTGMHVSESRGVLLATLVEHGVQINEYTPLQVKKALCGNGKAMKKQIGRAVQLLYKLDDIPKPDDAADALGIAYLCSLQMVINEKIHA